MNVGDKVYLVCVFPCETSIIAGTVVNPQSVGHDCCADVAYRYAEEGSQLLTFSRRKEDIAESPEAARDLMRAQIQKAKDEALAELARLDAIDVNAVEIQDL